MNFISKLKKMDKAVNHSYARWKRKIWLSLSLLAILYAGHTVWIYIWGPPTGGVTLIIHNELDRPILGFSVNGMAGSNAFAHGGGGTTCCGRISGRTAEIVWTLSTTREQYDAGVRKEVRRLTVPLPKRKRGENDLHVHFLSDDSVLLGWSDDAWSPYEKHSSSNMRSKHMK